MQDIVVSLRNKGRIRGMRILPFLYSKLNTLDPIQAEVTFQRNYFMENKMILVLKKNTWWYSSSKQSKLISGSCSKDRIISGGYFYARKYNLIWWPSYITGRLSKKRSSKNKTKYNTCGCYLRPESSRGYTETVKELNKVILRYKIKKLILMGEPEYIKNYLKNENLTLEPIITESRDVFLNLMQTDAIFFHQKVPDDSIPGTLFEILDQGTDYLIGEVGGKDSEDNLNGSDEVIYLEKYFDVLKEHSRFTYLFNENVSKEWSKIYLECIQRYPEINTNSLEQVMKIWIKFTEDKETRCLKYN